MDIFIPKAYAYTVTEVLDSFTNIASTSQETLVDAIVRFLPIAIPVVIFMAFMWWVLRRFGVRR